MIKWLIRGGYKDVTIPKVLNYFSAKFRFYITLYYGVVQLKQELSKEDNWVDKQANWRLTKVKEFSPKCIERGACIMCGCEWIDKKHYESSPCDKHCYPRWLDYFEWKVLESVIGTEAEVDYINFIFKKDESN